MDLLVEELPYFYNSYPEYKYISFSHTTYRTY